jgi:hypothetical protein
MNRLATITLVLSLASCHATRTGTGMISEQAPVTVYMTVADYYRNVPVVLNEAKDQIVSYPAPSDLFIGGELALPVRLKKGYLLDRRGLQANSAFTSYTYEEYSGMESPPSLQELYDHIIEKDPFKALYHCGNRSQYGDLVKELNRKIREGMPGCTPLIIH